MKRIYKKRKRQAKLRKLVFPGVMAVILLLPLLIPREVSDKYFVEYSEASRNTSTYIAHNTYEQVEVETVEAEEAPTSTIEKAEIDISADSGRESLPLAKIDTSKITEEDIDYLAKLVHAEFCGGGYEGRRAVANVVINRVADGNLGNSIKEVIERPGQFTPYKTGKLNTSYICPDCKEAVIDVIYNDYRIFPIYVMYFQSIKDGHFKNHETYMPIKSTSGKSTMFFSSLKKDINRYISE